MVATPARRDCGIRGRSGPRDGSSRGCRESGSQSAAFGLASGPRWDGQPRDRLRRGARAVFRAAMQRRIIAHRRVSARLHPPRGRASLAVRTTRRLSRTARARTPAPARQAAASERIAPAKRPRRPRGQAKALALPGWSLAAPVYLHGKALGTQVERPESSTRLRHEPVEDASRAARSGRRSRTSLARGSRPAAPRLDRIGSRRLARRRAAAAPRSAPTAASFAGSASELQPRVVNPRARAPTSRCGGRSSRQVDRTWPRGTTPRSPARTTTKPRAWRRRTPHGRARRDEARPSEASRPSRR